MSWSLRVLLGLAAAAFLLMLVAGNMSETVATVYSPLEWARMDGWHRTATLSLSSCLVLLGLAGFSSGRSDPN